MTCSKSSAGAVAATSRSSKIVPPPSLPTMTCSRRSSGRGASSAPASWRRARSPRSTRVVPGVAVVSASAAPSAMPVAVDTVPSMPARPRLACTGIALPGTIASATRMSREAARTSRSCGQVAAHTARTSIRRSTGARSTASSAEAKAARTPRSLETASESSGAGSPGSCDSRTARDMLTQPPTQRRTTVRSGVPCTRTSSTMRARRPGLYASTPGVRTTIVSTSSRSSRAGTSRLRVGCPNTIARPTASPCGPRSTSR